MTGASGFIGTRLVRWLQQRQVDVIATDLRPPREQVEGVTYLHWDVREAAPFRVDRKVDIVYNLAAVHRTPGHPPHAYYETNVLGASNVGAWAEIAGVQTIVFTSSISVYGPSEQILTEDSKLLPITSYGHSKRLAEAIHESWMGRSPGRRLVTVRPGVVFGPGERGNYTFLARALSRGIFYYPGRSTTIKSGGYIDELLAAIDFALSQPESKILFNFASPEESSIKDIVTAFGKVCGFRTRHATLPVAPLYVVAAAFEVANSIGLANPIHRERVMKLVRSTRVAPAWLMGRGYNFTYDLALALTAWRDETGGAFV